METKTQQPRLTKNVAMNIRQRAEEMADRFMKYLEKVEYIYSEAILYDPKFLATLNKENAAKVFKENNL